MTRLLCLSLCLSLCLLSLCSCSTYQTVKVDGKTPIFEFELSQVPQMMKVIIDTGAKYENDVKVLEPKPGEPQIGTVDYFFGFVGASGRGDDGSIADGYILREKLRIRTKDKNSPKFLQMQELIAKARADVLAGLSSIKKPVYVDKAVLD